VVHWRKYPPSRQNIRTVEFTYRNVKFRVKCSPNNLIQHLIYAFQHFSILRTWAEDLCYNEIFIIYILFQFFLVCEGTLRNPALVEMWPEIEVVSYDFQSSSFWPRNDLRFFFGT